MLGELLREREQGGEEAPRWWDASPGPGSPECLHGRCWDGECIYMDIKSESCMQSAWMW